MKGGPGVVPLKTGANIESTQVIGNTVTSAVAPNVTVGAPRPLPPIPSFTGTVQVTGNTLTEQQKLARGALEIKPNVPPKTYDGMYVGADGFAYPPDKFKVSEVPPFKPSNPVSQPVPTTYFVNGILTKTQDVAGAAQGLADRTGTNVVPIYNATENAAADIAQTGMDRLGLGNNKAVQTLANAISADLEAGRKVNVVGYSQGGAIVSSALQEVNQRITQAQGGWTAHLPVFGSANRQAREQLLGNINVVGIAGAGKNFPAGPQYNFYVNKKDPVPTLLGVHPYDPVKDTVLGLINSNPVLAAINGGPGLYNAPGANIHVINDQGQHAGDPFSPHYIDTYFGHIPPR